ncbi:MAG: hypothetical protein N3D73_03310, partial [Candidatus Diapherotrites archaeon]|nr:hypothetical protein [Candidatus Diapherotrites archaeon]
YYSSSVNSMLEEMAKNKIRFTDMYRYVIYNSLTQKYSPSFDAPKEVKNIFNTTNGSMQYISNIIRHIGAVYSPFAIGTDIDFVLYRDRYLPTFIILRDLASMISSSKYIMQIEYKFKYNDEFKKIMQKRRNIKDKQENIRLNQKLLDSYFKSIPIKYII